MRFPPLCAVLFVLALLAWRAPATSPDASPAHKAMALGELAMDRDRFEEAIGHFQVSLRLDPKLVENHLSIAGAHLALGQQRQALPYLEAYLAARPHHFLIRWHYADVLLRTDRPNEARVQLDRFVAEVQEHP